MHQELAPSMGRFLPPLELPSLSLGVDWGGRHQAVPQDEYGVMLVELRSGDASRVQQSLLGLSTKLAMAQENSVSTHILQLFIDPLISCLQSNHPPDIISKQECEG
jgi:hypothetical protein